MDGKGMIVCMSRRICVELYNELIEAAPGVARATMTAKAQSRS